MVRLLLIFALLGTQVSCHTSRSCPDGAKNKLRTEGKPSTSIWAQIKHGCSNGLEYGYHLTNDTISTGHPVRLTILYRNARSDSLLVESDPVCIALGGFTAKKEGDVEWRRGPWITPYGTLRALPADFSKVIDLKPGGLIAVKYVLTYSRDVNGPSISVSEPNSGYGPSFHATSVKVGRIRIRHIFVGADDGYPKGGWTGKAVVDFTLRVAPN